MGYLGIVLGILAVVAYVWKASADYTTLKNMQDNMVTKLALAKFEARIIKLLSDEYVKREDHEKLWGMYRNLRDKKDRENEGG